MNFGLLDPRFKYVPASKTDVSKTFARIRRQQAEQAKQEAAAQEEAVRKVRQIKRAAK